MHDLLLLLLLPPATFYLRPKLLEFMIGLSILRLIYEGQLPLLRHNNARAIVIKT